MDEQGKLNDSSDDIYALLSDPNASRLEVDEEMS